MAMVYSEMFIESVKLELLNRLGLKRVYYLKQMHDDLFYDAVGSEKGTKHRFRVRPATGTLDEFISDKWMRVHSFKIKSVNH
ncbi:hypothetical protein H1230_10525 [Paenibacillus sp. 19GGS1-52]|uniref:hypothetical protein n=1 Tax=Paenibacillus sp. 19GGS1-52 TaxID=2758563 RepID=UPI001EFB2F87|nr:hypothetical protein [Paenibacillus sp. 19GGS1-52]ULO09160.1 hypothetical protein H1230_10525 [Paenibacillus sp. 19GGS1-52]